MPRAARRAIVVLIAALTSVSAGLGIAALAEPDPAAIGLPRFVLDDFGGVSRATLETNALPYKVVATALLMREEQVRGVQLQRTDLPDVYRQFGFVIPDRFANWPASVPQPRFERPVGMVRREVRGDAIRELAVGSD